jgi:AraC-like DNA-binding protein
LPARCGKNAAFFTSDGEIDRARGAVRELLRLALMVENLAHTFSSRGQSTEQHRASTVPRRPLASVHQPLARTRPTGFDEPTLRQLARACDYDAQRISRHFDISVRHLQRWFKTYFASTPSVWLAEQRLLHARELLASSSSVKEVAYALGFKHVSQFSRDFRRRFGHRPSSELKCRRPHEMPGVQVQFIAECAGKSTALAAS